MPLISEQTPESIYVVLYPDGKAAWFKSVAEANRNASQKSEAFHIAELAITSPVNSGKPSDRL